MSNPKYPLTTVGSSSESLGQNIEQLKKVVTQFNQRWTKNDDEILSFEEAGGLLKLIIEIAKIEKFRDSVPFKLMTSIRTIDRKHKVGLQEALELLVNRMCQCPVSPLATLWRVVQSRFENDGDVFLEFKDGKYTISHRRGYDKEHLSRMPELRGFQKAFELLGTDHPALDGVDWQSFLDVTRGCISERLRGMISPKDPNPKAVYESEILATRLSFKPLMGYTAYLELRQEQSRWAQGEYRAKLEPAVALILILHHKEYEARLRMIMLMTAASVAERKASMRRIQDASRQRKHRAQTKNA